MELIDIGASIDANCVLLGPGLRWLIGAHWAWLKVVLTGAHWDSLKVVLIGCCWWSLCVINIGSH